jgi:hypothetical protein
MSSGLPSLRVWRSSIRWASSSLSCSRWSFVSMRRTGVIRQIEVDQRLAKSRRPMRTMLIAGSLHLSAPQFVIIACRSRCNRRTPAPHVLAQREMRFCRGGVDEQRKATSGREVAASSREPSTRLVPIPTVNEAGGRRDVQTSFQQGAQARPHSQGLMSHSEGGTMSSFR